MLGGKNCRSEYLTKSFSHSLASCTSFSFKMSTLSPSSGTLFPDQFTAQLHIQFEHFYDAQLWTRGFCFCFLFLPHSSQTFPKLKDPFPRPIYCLATHRVSTLLWCTALNQVHEWFLAVLFLPHSSQTWRPFSQIKLLLSYTHSDQVHKRFFFFFFF